MEGGIGVGLTKTMTTATAALTSGDPPIVVRRRGGKGGSCSVHLLTDVPGAGDSARLSFYLTNGPSPVDASYDDDAIRAPYSFDDEHYFVGRTAVRT